MSVRSPKTTSWKPHVSKKSEFAEIPKDKVLKFSYNSFKTGRAYLAKRQIDILVSKILLHPEKRSYFIQEINKLILYELGEERYE